MSDNLALQILALRHNCDPPGRNVIIHAGAIPITARALLSYDYDRGLFIANLIKENAIGEFSPTMITKIDGMEIWVD